MAFIHHKRQMFANWFWAHKQAWVREVESWPTLPLVSRRTMQKPCCWKAITEDDDIPQSHDVTTFRSNHHSTCWPWVQPNSSALMATLQRPRWSWFCLHEALSWDKLAICDLCFYFLKSILWYHHFFNLFNGLWFHSVKNLLLYSQLP